MVSSLPSEIGRRALIFDWNSRNKYTQASFLSFGNSLARSLTLPSVKSGSGFQPNFCPFLPVYVAFGSTVLSFSGA